MSILAYRLKIIIFISVMLILAGSLFLGAFLFYSLSKEYVGVISIKGYILTEQDRDLIVRMIDYAAKNESIKAVVIEIDSGGGWVAPIEEIYYRLIELNAKKPVVAAIVGTAASGGYYIAVSARRIFALPSSEIGNVGVIGFLPPKEQIDMYLHDESIMVTGPYKLSGTSEMTFPFTMQSILSSFLRAIIVGRGASLNVSEKELTMGLVYTGKEALEMGLVDEFGSTAKAIESAASMAGLREYEEVDLLNLVSSSDTKVGSLIKSYNAIDLEYLEKLNQSPSLYLIYTGYLSGNSISEYPLFKEDSFSQWNAQSEDEGYVLFDASHLNAYTQEEITPLLAEIMSKEHKVSFISEPSQFEVKLKKAEAFVVISPRDSFNEYEVSHIKDFVDGGGRLLLIMDPTRTYLRYINPLAIEFGIIFANGYLYNIEENYGNYRNIYVSPRGEESITEGVERPVFFTAAQIYPKKFGILFTANNTFWSESEAPGEFAVMCLLDDGRVLAIGDQTFIREPYAEIESNAKLVSGIANFLTASLAEP
ncbi:MAG: S49 family peptidase [Thermoproteota archaeon]